MRSKSISLVLPALLIASIVLLPIPAYAWQYGASMNPTTPNFDAYEMPTQGLQNWNTLSSGNGITFWVSASNTGSGGGFAQNGFAVNNDTGVSVCYGTAPSGETQTCLSPGEWGIWFEYCFSCGSGGTYYGNAEWSSPPGTVSPTDEWYFSGATYASKGEYSFLWYDASAGKAYTNYVCTLAVNGKFTGDVGGISESGASSGYGSIYVHGIALWAEIISNNTRNSGTTSAYNSGSSPSADHTYVASANDADIGFTSSGSHTTSGTLWNGNSHATDEDVPSDYC